MCGSGQQHHKIAFILIKSIILGKQTIPYSRLHYIDNTIHCANNSRLRLLQEHTIFVCVLCVCDYA